MKKYLMTGIAALAMCFGFTSCSHEFDNLSQEEIDQMKANEIVENYKKAFIENFGQPAADQEWGFGTNATRSENANANEWADPDKEYGGLLVPPPLTDAQIAVVKKYFQTVRNPQYQDPQWTNYFIQQVYKGGTDPKTGTDPITGKSYSPEKYVAADGNTWITGSNNMDHLAAINGTFVDHINNFNHGDCSPNGDVLDNGEHVGGAHHTDKIMYMKNSTTASFGYYNSNGSIRRTEYTGLVSYQTIINALGSEANCLNDGWNRSFMGFDFEQMVGDEVYANAYYTYNNQQYRYLSSNMNMYCGDLREYNDMNGVDIAGLLADGYLPVQNSADKKWVKLGGCADGYYSDWIVTLTEAKTKDTDEYSIRVIAEDLTFGKDLNTDFDFNDVFDVCLKSNETKIRLKAAGGTLPLIIGVANPQNDQEYTDNEVHKLFNVAINVMVNTNAEGKGLNGASKPDAFLTLNTAYSNAKDIPVYVKKNGTWVELTAVKGEPASKIGVGLDYVWVDERESLKGRYTKFVDWVKADANERGFIWW